MFLFTKILFKIGDVFHHMEAWFIACLLFVVSIFAPHWFLISLVSAVTLVDAAWGITVSVRHGRFALSELMRLSVVKLAIYGCALFGFAGLDMFVQMQTGLELSLTTSVIGIVIILIELWSTCASMLILFPHFPFLYILKRALTGEIAHKLGVSEDEVAGILNRQNNDRR